MEHLQTLTIAYECESSLGNSLNIKKMTREFLRIFLKKTSAVYATINELDNESNFPLNSVGKDEFYKLTIDAKPNNIDKFCIVNIVHNNTSYRFLYILLDDYYLAFVYSQKNQIDIEVLANIFHSLKNKIELGIKACKEHERLELALLGSDNGLWDWDLRNNSVYFSPRWKEMLGYSDSELKNEFSTWQERVHPDDLEPLIEGIQENIDGKKDHYKGSFRLKHKNGSWVWILAHGKAIFDENNKAIRMTGMHTDITKQTEAEKNLKVQYNLLHTIVDTVPVRIFWKDQDGAYLGVNKLFLKDAQLNSVDEIIGKTDYAMPWGETEAQLYRDDDLQVMKSGVAKMNFEETQTDDDGNQIVLLTSKVPLKGETQSVIGVLGTYTDITSQRNIEETLREQTKALNYQANHDVLTSLPNRVLCNDRLEQAIQKAKRDNSKIALLFIDLDHFKEINDSLGHDVGDKVLVSIASRLSSSIRDEDTLARLGGDEFIIILEDLSGIQDASSVSKKILDNLSQAIYIDDATLYISSSIGISIYPDDGTSTQDLLKFADSAMYKAKDEGRNNFQYYSSDMTELASLRVEMEANLRNALEKEEFIVHYQVQVNGADNKIIGMEALVRWQHPTMGLVAPSKFIPLAESTGLIVEIDRYVMKTAMTQITQWYKQGLNPGVLAMNLSMKQLQKDDFVEILENLMKDIGCKAKWLELEVTEGQIMKNPKSAIKTLQKISALGIELAIDDFGTGYSSLSYLKKLPIDKLKIDQDFIRGLPDDEEDSAIAKAVIALTKSLNLSVIAEGVESKEQKDFLIANGCDTIQGYFYSKPVPAHDLEILLENTFEFSP